MKIHIKKKLKEISDCCDTAQSSEEFIYWFKILTHLNQLKKQGITELTYDH